MCIIIYKPRGQRMPSAETLKNCFTNNPDGAGFMYSLEDAPLVAISKGYMSFVGFSQAIDKLRPIEKHIELIMHFRITTHGLSTPANCHPFALSRDMSDLVQLEANAQVGVAHNGIISLSASYKSKYSDTMLYITDYLSLMLKSGWEEDDDTLALIERTCKSKLALMTNRKTTLIGKFIHEQDGCFYSNDGYKKREYSKCLYNGKHWDEQDELAYWEEVWEREQDTSSIRKN